MALLGKASVLAKNNLGDRENEMKEVVKELVKFNLKAILLFFVIGIVIYLLDPKSPNMKVGLFIVFIFMWYAFGNLKIIYQSRREIINFFKKGSVEIAAGVIEFKEHASTRARERIEEKAKKDNNKL